MTSKIIPVQSFECVIFGATGDLASRKLIPALYHRLKEGKIENTSRIIGAARRNMDTAAYRELVKDAVTHHVSEAEIDADVLNSFLGMIEYISVDASSDKGWPDLKSYLVTLEADKIDRVRLFYLAVGPAVFGLISNQLEAFQLVTPSARLILEKPIGHDGRSAKELNDLIGKVFDESQVFRIDHYLGKETVQNLMALRFGNILYEPLWNNAYIDHVQITVSETLGVEERGNYYNTAGAIRDMVQNHMLQLLCLVAMEPPSTFSANAVRDEKIKVLRALKPIEDADAKSLTVRGQYKAGASNGQPVAGYLDEIDDEESSTETFVALKAEISNWRWSGVPFYLRTGKRLAGRVSEIVVQFKALGHNLFSDVDGELEANRMIIRLQPDEGIKQHVMMKDPGPGGMRFRQVPLDMTFADSFNLRHPDAYERLIMDVVRGDQTLFMRRDEVEQAWAWIDPILEAWETNKIPVHAYTAGSSGPPKSYELITRDGRSWHGIDGDF